MVFQSKKEKKPLLYLVPSFSLSPSQDWAWLGDASTGWREGLWYRCLWNTGCTSLNYYTGGCNAIISTVRAFSISTICLAFITMCWLLLIIVREGCYIPATLLGFLTMRWRSLSLCLSHR